MRGHFAVGSHISWTQYACKGSALGHVRTGDVWADCPAFPGASGAHVWVIPDNRLPSEAGAIAVRVHRGGQRRGEAEVHEDSPAYRDYSLKEQANVD